MSLYNTLMCEFTDFEMEKQRIKKKLREAEEENWEAEPELEKHREERPIEISS
jgi:hypothetical protein